MKRKIITFLCIVIAIFLLFSIAAYAEDTPPPEDSSVEDLPNVTYSVVFEYASDSTANTGITYETYSDTSVDEFGFKIVNDLPIGHVIYDDPNTTYIDGIRVNGATVNSLKVAITDTSITKYTVVVRTVYAEGILGDIAKMSDGTYDWAQLLENPLVLLQLIYYAAAIISLLGGAIIASTSKKVKAKTSNEIADKVSSAAHTSLIEIKQEVTEAVIQEATPILNKILTACEDVVKAATLATSKSKEAPLTLLDVLHHAASNTDTTELIAQIRQNVGIQITRDAETHSSNVETLHNIEARASTPAEAPKEVEHAPEPKSVF